MCILNLSMNLNHVNVGCFHIYPLMIIIMCLMKFSLPLLFFNTFFMYMLHNYIKIYDWVKTYDNVSPDGNKFHKLKRLSLLNMHGFKC